MQTPAEASQLGLGNKSLQLLPVSQSGLHFQMFCQSLTADVLLRSHDPLEGEVKSLYTNRMPVLLSTLTVKMPRDFPSLQSLSILKGSKKILNRVRQEVGERSCAELTQLWGWPSPRGVGAGSVGSDQCLLLQIFSHLGA